MPALAEDFCVCRVRGVCAFERVDAVWMHLWSDVAINRLREPLGSFTGCYLTTVVSHCIMTFTFIFWKDEREREKERRGREWAEEIRAEGTCRELVNWGIPDLLASVAHTSIWSLWSCCRLESRFQPNPTPPFRTLKPQPLHQPDLLYTHESSLGSYKQGLES